MKDAEFIELLNLYVDHEISEPDAARLETEVQNNPARRQTYQQYCRMQKACKVLAQDFQAEATAIAERTIVAFEPNAGESRRIGFMALGTLAAAACVAFVFVSRNREIAANPVAQSPVVEQVPTAVQPAVAAPASDAPRTIAHAVSIPPAQRAVGGSPLLLTGRTQADAMLAAAAEQTNNQFEWMRTVQLSPMQQRVPLENLRFEKQPAPLQLGSRTYGSPQLPDANIEWTAFRFNK